MQFLQFWKSWPAEYRRILAILFLVFGGSLIFLLVAFVNNPAPVFTWQQFQDLQLQEIPLYNFDVGLFNFTITTDNYIVFERWAGNPISISLQPLAIYLVFLLFSLAVLIAIITTLRPFWFLIGCGILIFLLNSFQWDTLNIIPVSGILSAIVITFTIGLAVLFQYTRISASFSQRVVVFLLWFSVMAAGIIILSPETRPFELLAVNTLPAAIGLLIIFIIMVAHEIVAGFVMLVSQGSGQTGSLRNLLIISFVYLLNLWLLYLDRIEWFEWSLGLSPIIILPVSSVLGVWGIRQRWPQYENITASDPFAVYFILALGTVALAVTGYFMSSAQDLAVLSMSDIILYTHIGYGTVFLAYVGSNFLDMLRKDQPVHKVLYKPTAMPYFSYRLAGLIFTLAFIFYNRWQVPITHFRSACYTAMGDWYYHDNQMLFAAGYYEKANSVAPHNQHASTALANLENGSSKKALKYYSDANQFRSTEFTILNYAHALYLSGKNIEELYLLRQAARQLPNSSAIRNDLGLSFLRLGLTDSALVCFSDAALHPPAQKSAELNLLGLIAEKNLTVNPDSLHDPGLKEQPNSNRLAIANQRGKWMDAGMTLPRDSSLNLFTASYIGNYLTNHLNKTDTTLLSQAIRLARMERNRPFREIIFVPASRACYAYGKVNEAFELLHSLIIDGVNPARHYMTLVLWTLEQNKPDVSLAYLRYAMNQNAEGASWVNAIALAEAGKIDESLIAWDTLNEKSDSLIPAARKSMKRVLGGPDAWFASFTDFEKYRFLRYRVSALDSVRFNKLIDQISDEDMKARAVFDHSKKLFDLGYARQASRVFQKLQGLHLNDVGLFSRIKYFELHLVASRGQWQALKEQLDKGIMNMPYRETERIYFETLILLANGDSIAATPNLAWLGRANSFFDDGVVTAARFFLTDKSNYKTSYSILSEALQVNPHSVKILKDYILVAKAMGFDPYAVSSLLTLRSLIPPDEWKRYLSQNNLEDLVQ